MTEPLQLGLFLPSVAPDGKRALSFEEIATLALQAEEAGFHSLWWPDHYFIENRPGERRGSFECWTLLAALAGRTSRIKLGSLVLCNTFRHPALLTKQAASLHELSGGRAIIGLGAGWHLPEYQALGLPFTHRVGRLEESAAAMRELLDTGTSSFEGRWLKLNDAELLPRPTSKLPLWIAASGPHMLDLTARFADGWNLAWFGGDPGPFGRKAGQLREAVAKAGRAVNAVELTVGIQAQVAAPGQEDATRQAVRAANPLLAGLDDATLGKRVLIGDPAMVAQTLQQYATAGASLAIIGMAGLSSLPADEGAMTRLLHDVPAAIA